MHALRVHKIGSKSASVRSSCAARVHALRVHEIGSKSARARLPCALVGVTPVAEDKAPNPTPAMVGAIHLAEGKAPNPTPAMVGARHSHHEISSRRADARVKSSRSLNS